MPKISTHSMWIDIEGNRQLFSVQVFYDQDFKFYVIVPAEYHEGFDQLNEKDRVKFSTDIKYQYRWQRGKQTRIVKADTEDGAVESMKKLLSRLVSLSITKEQVIMITFEDESHPDHYGNTYGTDLPRVGLSLEATYCTKVSSPGADPKFYKYRQDTFRGETSTVRSEVGRHAEDLVIPDTPENRKFIEDLHSALGVLLGKFKEFTATPESILDFIGKRQILLANGNE